MPTRDHAPIGAPCWIGLSTSDPARSQAFYTALFGWTAGEPDEQFGGYVNFMKDGSHVAGCMGSQPTDAQTDVWTVYLATDDAQKTVETATANGGQVIVPPMAVGDLGTMAVVSDGAGAVIGAWQADQFPGFQVLAEPGTPAWFELHTGDYDNALPFYREVFRWDLHVMSDAPEFRYATLFEGDQVAAGIMDSTVFEPEGTPAAWSVYVSVEDTDAAAVRVAELGGTVTKAAMDTPYGRLALAVDPTGSVFKLHGPNIG